MLSMLMRKYPHRRKGKVMRHTVMIGILTFICSSFSLVGMAYAQDTTTKKKWSPKRYRLTVPNPDPGEARTNLRLIKLSLKPATPSPTATELLYPIVRILNNLEYQHQTTVNVRNASDINRADHLGKAPDRFIVEAKIKTKEKLGKGLRAVHFSVAQRSLIALKNYKMRKNEVYGKVCLSVPRLADAEKRIDGRIEFKMPAAELLKLQVRERDETRYAGLMMEHDRGDVLDLNSDKILDVSRFRIPSRIGASWARSRLALLAQGIPQDNCVLVLKLQKTDKVVIHQAKLAVPKNERVLTAQAFQIRVAPLGERLYGKPVIRRNLAWKGQ